MNNRTGKLIEKYRKEKGLTQSELANKLGVSNTAVSKWEHGNNLPDITLLEPLSEILGIDKLILFTSENEDKEESRDIKNNKKTNIIKSSISILVFIVLLSFSHIITYKVYKHRLDNVKSSQIEIYKFHNEDEEFSISGYIIFKENKSTVIFERLSYQDIRSTRERTKPKTTSEDITSVELYMLADEKVVLKKFALNNKRETEKTNDLLLKLAKSNQDNVKIDKNNLKKLEIKITMNKNEIEESKKMKLEISKEI